MKISFFDRYAFKHFRGHFRIRGPGTRSPFGARGSIQQRRSVNKKLLGMLCIMTLAACTGNNASVPAIQAEGHRMIRHDLSGPIQHVIIVVQENRTVDNLFQGLPGASTQAWGLNSQNQQVTLQPVPLTAPYDLLREHPAFVGDYNGGAMNGFNNDRITVCRGTCPAQATASYGYVSQSETQPYFALAEQYGFGDEMFQTNEGPSFPAHQYLLSGTSSISSGSSLNEEDNPPDGAGGCDAPPQTTVTTIDMVTGAQGSPVFPCFNRSSLINEMNAAGVTWRYYQSGTGPGLWHAVDALQPIWSDTSEYDAHIVSSPSRFLTDVKHATLAQVTWVTPTALASDHASRTNGTGPSWVASIVNTVAASPFWNSTAIIVVWDDWGGWYDHVTPAVRNPYELGFRVPVLVISPYAKPGYVSHVNYEFGSILKFTEEQFGLPSLGTTDTGANDLSDFFNFTQARRKVQADPSPARRAVFHLTSGVQRDTG